MAKQLGDASRRATAALVHPLVKTFRQPLGAERGIDQRRGVAQLERLEPHTADLGRAEQRTLERIELAAGRRPPGDQHHQPQGARLGDQVGEQLVRFARREMEILHCQDDARRRARAVRERRGEALVEAVALGCLAAAGTAAGRRVDVDTGSTQRLEHRLEGFAAGARLTDAHRGALDRRQQAELAHQPRLPHAFGALDYRHPALAAQRFGERLAKGVEGGVAAHHARGEQRPLPGLGFVLGLASGRAPQLGGELARRREPPSRIAVEQPAEDRGELDRHVRPGCQRIRHRRFEMKPDRRQVVAGRRQNAGGQMKERQAERVEIRALVVDVLQQDLRRRVGEGAADAPVERPARALREPEVEDLELQTGRGVDEPEVLRLDVEVQHAVAMDVRQPGGRLNGQIPEQRPAAVPECLPQVGALDQLHGEERKVPRQNAEVVHLHDVGMTHLREQAHLVAQLREVLRRALMERHFECRGAVGLGAGADAVHRGARGARHLPFHQHVTEQTLEIGEVGAAVAQPSRGAAVLRHGCVPAALSARRLRRRRPRTAQAGAPPRCAAPRLPHRCAPTPTPPPHPGALPRPADRPC